LELFADWTTAAVGADVVALPVVVVLEVVEDDPQAAAMAAAGTSPRTMPHRP
jgi:hypothetical protein